MALPISIVPDAKSKTIFVVGTQGRKAIASPYHVTLLNRARVNTGADKMLAVELDIVRSYTRAVS